MTSIHRAARSQHAPSHKPSAAAEEMVAAAQGTFPTVVLDQKLSAQVEKMRPTVQVHEAGKKGNVQLVYHFKDAAAAKAVYEQATELDAKTGKRFPSSSLGDN